MVAKSPSREAKRRWLQGVFAASGMTQREFAARMDVGEATLSGMLNGHRPVSDDKADQIMGLFGASFDLGGTQAHEPASRYTIKENIVCVDVRARAGYLSGFGDPQYLSDLPTYRVPDLPPGTYRDFEVEGFSMLNPRSGQIHPGSHVIAEATERGQHVNNGRVYVVVTSEDVLVKRVFIQDGTITLRSDNPDRETYPDIHLPLSEVRELWYVRQLRTDKIPPPEGNTEQVMDMERRLAELETKLARLTG